jgi:hypothetical protein
MNGINNPPSLRFLSDAEDYWKISPRDPFIHDAPEIPVD